MSLIVEDGTIVADANSYVDLDEIKAYATSRGVDLGSDDAVIEILSNKAVDYLEGKRDRYQGNKVDQYQDLQFPRFEVYVDGFLIAADQIPKELKNAQCQLIIEQHNGVDILPTLTVPAVKKEVVGPVETEYAVYAGSTFEPTFQSVDILLEPLFKKSIIGSGLTTVRV